MITPIAATVASKATGPVITVVRNLWRRLTFNWRAARAVEKLAAAQGVDVIRKQIKVALADGKVYSAIEVSPLEPISEAVDKLSGIELRLAGGEVVSDPARLWIWIRRAYTKESEPSAAVALSQAATDLQHSAVMTAIEALGLTGTAFDRLVSRLSTVQAATALDLRPRFPHAVERIVDAVANSDDRKRLYTDWFNDRPPWLGEIAPIHGWLGELALEVEANNIAARWIDSALALGASPRGYWKVRRFWAEPAEDPQDDISYLSDVEDYPLVRAILKSNTLEDRRTALSSWNPSRSAEAILKMSLSADYARAAKDLDEAIRIGQDALDNHGFGGPAIVAAEALIHRSVVSRQRFQARDLSEARTLALRVRDMQREWGAASGRAVAVAMKSSLLLMDPERAWKLSQLPPIGEANALEASAPYVRNLAIILMAERGSFEEAWKLLDDTYPDRVRLQLRAQKAELELDDQEAIKLWAQAIQEADDWEDKASITIRLATKGVRDPFVEQLRPNNPDLAHEIDVLIALFGEESGGEAKALAESHENQRIAHALISYFGEHAKTAEMIAAAERAAERWNDADDWLQAARGYQSIGQSENAIDRANKALQVGGADWGNRFGALVVLTEAAFHEEDWSGASIAARSMIEERPKDPGARWALVLVQLRAGDDEDAYTTWKETSPPPGNVMEAEAWLTLFRLHGSDMATVAEVLAVSEQFKNDEHVRAMTLGALTFGPITEQGATFDLSELAAGYANDFPEGTAWRTFQVDEDHPDTIIEQLNRLAGRTETHAEIEAALQMGTAPVGIGSMIGGRLYAELLIRRFGPRFVGNLAPGDEVAAASASVGGTVVIDTTALVTLCLLPDDGRDLLISKFARLRATTQQLRDANATRERLSQSSVGEFIPGFGERKASFEPADPSLREMLMGRIQRLQELFRRTDRVSNENQHSPIAMELENAVGAWSSALDYAAAENITFWCDDAATRAMLAKTGTPAFGTAALIEHLRDAHIIDDDLADSLDASLIHSWGVGVVFRESSFELALALDSWEPKGTAAAIRFSGGEHAVAKLTAAFGAMGRAQGNPDALVGWARTVFTYGSEVAGDQPAKITNGQLTLFNALVQPWIDPSRVAAVVTGLHKTDIPEAEVDQIIQGGFRLLDKRLIEQFGHPAAAAFLLENSSQLSESDHRTVVGVILER